MSFIIDNFSILTLSRENAQRFKKIVLDLMVKGKLTTQDLATESADALLKRVQMNRDALKKEKFVKSKYRLHQKAKKEPPFEIPVNWKWVRFWDVIYCYRGHNPPKSEFIYEPAPGYIRFVQITDFKTDEKAVYVPETHKLKRIYKGEIIMAAYRHIGKLSREMEGAFNVALCKVMNIEPFSRDYLELLIKTDLVKGELLRASGRGHIPSMHSDHLLSLWVPIPPLSEQHRIVQKVNTLFQQIDQLAEQSGRAEATRQQLRVALLHRLEQAPDRATTATAWQPLAEQFDLAIRTRDDVQALRQTILQLAVRGALVPQDPGDEPAGELLKRIKIEKERLVKAGEIRKEKALPPVTEEEVPFQVPVGWVWCRLGDIAITRSGVTKGKKYKTALFSVPYLRVANVQRGYLDLDQVKEISVSENDIQKYQLEIGDLLMTEGGDADKLGRCAIWNNEIEGCIHQNHIFCVRSLDKTKILSQYIELFANSKTCREYFEGCAKQTTNLASINMTVLKNTPIALPPSLEQHCIVQKVEALLGWCDELEAVLEEMGLVEERLVGAALRV